MSANVLIGLGCLLVGAGLGYIAGASRPVARPQRPARRPTVGPKGGSGTVPRHRRF